MQQQLTPQGKLRQPRDISSAPARPAPVEVQEEDPGREFEDEADQGSIAQDLQSIGAIWTIPLLCAGIAIIAACMIIPAADENRRLVYEREKLKRDLEQIEQQVEVNNQFLKRVADDPNLFERLAQRQMKMVREGTSVLDLGHGNSREMSPYELVHVPPPLPLPPYQPMGGRFAQICRSPRHNLYLTGTGLLLIASGLILGATGLASHRNH